MKRIGWLGILMVVLLVGVSGCTDDLGTVDLSGVVDLSLSHDGWAYRVIGTERIYQTPRSAYQRLDEFRGGLELRPVVRIGTDDYMIISRFDREFQTDVYHLDGHRPVRTMILKCNETGDPWHFRLAEGPFNAVKYEFKRTGQIELFFNERSTGADYIVESNYRIESKAVREVDKTGKFVQKHGEFQWDRLSVSGSSELRMGARQCLTGKTSVGGKTIWFYVLDWDFDGKFTEADRVWCDYNKEFLNFNETIRLTGSWQAAKDNTYRLRLEEPAADGKPYILHIEIEGVGVR
ncbi:MAG TPA: hypothetical protein PL004_11370 [Bacillota bacterium]|nr:hypothetical protein [Bacillota bacterium]